MLLSILENELLLHTHTWVRLASARVFGMYFGIKSKITSLNPLNHEIDENLLKSFSEDHSATATDNLSEFLFRKSTMFRLFRQTCLQLEGDHVSNELGDQIIKNLVFLASNIMKYPALSQQGEGDGEGEEEGDEKEEEKREKGDEGEEKKKHGKLAPGDWIFRRLSFMLRRCIDKNEPRATIIMKWFGTMGGSVLPIKPATSDDSQIEEKVPHPFYLDDVLNVILQPLFRYSNLGSNQAMMSARPALAKNVTLAKQVHLFCNFSGLPLSPFPFPDFLPFFLPFFIFSYFFKGYRNSQKQNWSHKICRNLQPSTKSSGKNKNSQKIGKGYTGDHKSKSFFKNENFEKYAETKIKTAESTKKESGAYKPIYNKDSFWEIFWEKFWRRIRRRKATEKVQSRKAVKKILTIKLTQSQHTTIESES